MAKYYVKYTDSNKIPLEVDEGTVDLSSLDIPVFGRIRLEYGEKLNQAIVNLLENFASVANSGNIFTPDLTETSDNLLSSPIEGQQWFNKSQNRIAAFDGTLWETLANQEDYAASWGQIKDGEQLPKPVSDKTGYVFDYSECIWVVAPFNVQVPHDWLECSTDDAGVVTMKIHNANSDTPALTDNLYANYMIIGIRGNSNLGTITPTTQPLVVTLDNLSLTANSLCTAGSNPNPIFTNTPVADDGTVTATVTGGSGNYLYQWEYVPSSNTTGLVPEIGTPNSPSTKFYYDPADCNAYTADGRFRCVVTDAQTGATVTSDEVSVTIVVSSDASVNVSITDITSNQTCLSTSNSTVTATVTSNELTVIGGTPPYNFQWVVNNNPDNLTIDDATAQYPTFSRVVTGTECSASPVSYVADYTLTVTDSATTPSSMSVPVTVTINVSPSSNGGIEVTPNAVSGYTSCASGATNINVTSDVAYGAFFGNLAATPNTTYSWAQVAGFQNPNIVANSPNAINTSFSLASGVTCVATVESAKYVLVASDPSFGQVTSNEVDVTLTISDGFSGYYSGVQSSSAGCNECAGALTSPISQSLSFTAVTNGGSGSYSYSWNVFGASPEISITGQNTNTITITHTVASGTTCAYIAESLSLSCDVTDNVTGQTVTINHISGNNGVIFTVNPVSNPIKIELGGLYSITKTCPQSTQPQLALTASASYGTPPYTYSWAITNQPGNGSVSLSNPNIQDPVLTLTSPDLSNVANCGATYTATISCTATDADGCTISGTQDYSFVIEPNVSTPLSLTLDKTQLATTVCCADGSTPNINYGNVTATASGGVAPYTYAWSVTGSVNTSPSPTTANSGQTTGSFTTGFTQTNLQCADFTTPITWTATCVVTDSVGNTTSVSLPIELTWMDSVLPFNGQIGVSGPDPVYYCGNSGDPTFGACSGNIITIDVISNTVGLDYADYEYTWNVTADNVNPASVSVVINIQGRYIFAYFTSNTWVCGANSGIVSAILNGSVTITHKTCTSFSEVVNFSVPFSFQCTANGGILL